MENKGKVKNKVLTALLQAYHDTLDYDGMKSILREANLLDLKDIRDVDPNNSLDFLSFHKIISAQNSLLFCCSELLYTIGSKFAFYLFPWGKSFSDVINELPELINTDWTIQLIEESNESTVVKVENCVFSSNSGEPCDLIKGFITYSLEKSLPSNKRVILEQSLEGSSESKQNVFTLKFKIEDIN